LVDKAWDNTVEGSPVRGILSKCDLSDIEESPNAGPVQKENKQNGKQRRKRGER
jgi:hypothetical protein